MFTIEIDDREVRRLLERMATSLEDFTPEMKDILRGMERSNRLTFEAGGRPGKFKPLAEATIEARRRKERRTGRRYPAGIATPLRESDALFKSLTSPNAAHAIAEATKDEAVSGTDLPYAGRQQAEREFLLFQESDEEAYIQRMVAGLRQRAARAATASRTAKGGG